jgi:hypothetical protein
MVDVITGAAGASSGELMNSSSRWSRRRGTAALHWAGHGGCRSRDAANGSNPGGGGPPPSIGRAITVNIYLPARNLVDDPECMRKEHFMGFWEHRAVQDKCDLAALGAGTGTSDITDFTPKCGGVEPAA